LYVGATRAKRRLHLLALADADARGEGAPCWKRPRRGTALERLWDALATKLPAPPEAARMQEAAQTPAPAAVEWALSGEDQGRIVHVVLDRSFVAGGCRYVVDFKTGAHEGADAAAFLAREFERYQAQLIRYARIVAAFDPRPIRIALYHPLVDGGWQESLGSLGSEL
jgi:ATP-dependent exoDNAse (exonuclease V) beta subunit